MLHFVLVHLFIQFFLQIKQRQHKCFYRSSCRALYGYQLIEQRRRIPDGHSNRYRHQKRAVELESSTYVKSKIRGLFAISNLGGLLSPITTKALRPNLIKRVKAVFSKEVLETALLKTTKTVKRIFRILLRNPWDDFDYVIACSSDTQRIIL